ncbi:MAG: hypothetical protein DSY83_13220 [Flavobacteriia bacterium]|nr:MAG: hypothetical protein DSY83_13220 [Flavobacteriia bacterium]
MKIAGNERHSFAGYFRIKKTLWSYFIFSPTLFFDRIKDSGQIFGLVVFMVMTEVARIRLFFAEFNRSLGEYNLERMGIDVAWGCTLCRWRHMAADTVIGTVNAVDTCFCNIDMTVLTQK